MMDDIYDDQRHATDIDLTCCSSWDTVHSFDWEQKVQNTTVDVLRGVQVGLAKNKEGVRMLLLRFVDTAVDCVTPPGGAWYNWKDSQPSVWAIAFTAREVRAISKAVCATSTAESSTAALLIHREPWTEPSTWCAKAEWMVETVQEEDSQITGVRISLRASQDIVPQIHEVRFLTKGHYFRLSSRTDVSPDAWDLVSASYQQAIITNQLPAAQSTHSSLQMWDPPTQKIPIRTDYVSQGDSPIECEMNVDILNGGVPSTARMYHSKCGDNRVLQVVTSGKVILRNPTDDKLYVQSASTDLSTTGSSQDGTSEAESQASTTRIGAFRGTSMDWGMPHPDVAWTTKTSWELPPKSVHELCVESSIVLPSDAAPAYGSKPFNMRLHPHFDEPITIRATFVDNEKRTQSISWDYSNPLLEPRDVNSYADALANEKYCQNGIGEQFECLVFLYWDNPKTLMRTYLVVTRDRTAPAVYLRIADTTGAFPSSYTKFTKDDITRIIYDAEEGTTRIDQTNKCCTSTSHCRVWLLMDPQLKVVYGIETQIVEDATCGQPVILLSQAAYLDPTPTVTSDRAT